MANLYTTTRSATSVPSAVVEDAVPCLTVLHHPDIDRVGDRVRLLSLVSGRSQALSRVEPEFSKADGAITGPLADSWVSRSPVTIQKSGSALEIVRADGAMEIIVDGQVMGASRKLSADALDTGVVIELAGRVVLLLHALQRASERPAPLGLVGDSPAMDWVRADILRAAEVGVPVLIRGETGSGKELVARAIHDNSKRASARCVCVNMAAVPPTTAASELFGHVEGAFSGAVRDHAGFFGAADGGSLFLDEIGETPAGVQSMLLRALETGEIQRVGAPDISKVNVRLIAATDADLELLGTSGEFSRPLYYRLAGFQIQLPPLRARRDDIGRLVVHFLRDELAALGATELIEGQADNRHPWLTAPLVGRLARHAWPGNVRELRNVVRQIVVSCRGEPAARIPAALESAFVVLDLPDAPATIEDVTDDRLVAVLRKHRFRVGPAATELGMSRPSLYARIDKSDRVRKATDLTRDQIDACRQACEGDLDRMAEQLEVSKRGLQLRIRSLSED